MRRNLLFVGSLLLVALVSWCNVEFSSETYHLPEWIKQGFHLFTVLFAGFMGYLHWRQEAKWLQSFWMAIYIIGTIALGVLFAIYSLTHYPILRVSIARIRESLGSILPLLVFYIISKVSHNLQNSSTQTPD
jgi:hypothetical protein